MDQWWAQARLVTQRTGRHRAPACESPPDERVASTGATRAGDKILKKDPNTEDPNSLLFMTGFHLISVLSSA